MPAVMVHPQAVAAALRSRAREKRLWGVGQFLIGILLTVLAPIIASAVLASQSEWQMGPLFVPCLVICTAAMAVAYFQEWRNNGSDGLIWRLREIGSGYTYESWNSRYWRYSQIELALHWEIWRFIPRCVFEGWSTIRMVKALEEIPLDRPATLLAKLLERDRRMEIDSLRQSSTDHDSLAFSRSLAYLLFFEWIAASEDGQRIWAGTETRQLLSGSCSD